LLITYLSYYPQAKESAAGRAMGMATTVYNNGYSISKPCYGQ